MKKSVTASAPGKIILTGEHFVVHGSYAVAAAINKRVRVTASASKNEFTTIVSGGASSKLEADDGKFPAAKTVVRQVLKELDHRPVPLEVRIESDIPPGSGLGSSAAVSIAVTAAVTRYLDSKVDARFISQIALAGEKIVHGNPSGIDTAASLKGGVIMFKRDVGAKAIKVKDLKLVVIYSGKKRSTSRLIADVARRREAFPNFFQKLAESASYQSLEVADALKLGDLRRLGFLFNIAQAELHWIGVSTPFIDRLIEKTSKSSLGAKITGAGGGGSIIVVTRPESLSSLVDSVAQAFPETFITSIRQSGLRFE